MKEALLELSHSKLLNAQRIYRLITNHQTEIESATYDQKMIIKVCIECGDLQRLRQLIRKLANSDLETMPVSELRKLGQKYQIKDYARLTKITLLSILQKRISDDSGNTTDIPIRDENISSTIGCAIRSI